MKFEATDEQISEIAANAVNASLPMGMGHFHYRPDCVFKPEDFTPDLDGLSLDYVQGRMVKLHLHRTDRSTWEMSDNASEDYQSWVRKYPTPQALVNSVLKKVKSNE